MDFSDSDLKGHEPQLLMLFLTMDTVLFRFSEFYFVEHCDSSINTVFFHLDTKIIL